MISLWAQGDLLIERISDAAVSGQILARNKDGSVVVAEGELTGHCHRLVGAVTLYRDEAMARDIPSALYVAHVRANGPVRLQHEEHDPIALAGGTYRLRRQRQLEPTDIGLAEQTGLIED